MEVVEAAGLAEVVLRDVTLGLPGAERKGGVLEPEVGPAFPSRCAAVSCKKGAVLEPESPAAVLLSLNTCSALLSLNTLFRRIAPACRTPGTA